VFDCESVVVPHECDQTSFGLADFASGKTAWELQIGEMLMLVPEGIPVSMVTEWVCVITPLVRSMWQPLWQTRQQGWTPLSLLPYMNSSSVW